MIKRALLLLVLGIILIHDASAQGFDRVYNPTVFEEGGALIREVHGDGGLDVMYLRNNFSVYDISRAHIDYEGIITYNPVSYDTLTSDHYYNIRPSYWSDSGLVIATHLQVGTYDGDVRLARYDKHDNLLWAVQFGDTLENLADNPVEGPDKSIYLPVLVLDGRTRRVERYETMKFDSSGNHVWTYIMSSGIREGYQQLHVLPDGSCINHNYWYSFNNPDHKYDGFRRIDSAGNFDTLILGNYRLISTESISIQTADAGYLTAGKSDTTPSTDYDSWIVLHRYNASFDSLWTFELPETDTIYSYFNPTAALETANGDILYTGRLFNEVSNSFIGFYLGRISSSGTQLWLRHYELGGERSPNRIEEDYNGDIYLWGQFKPNLVIGDCWLFKCNAEGVYSKNFLSGTVYIEDDTASCTYDNIEPLLSNWVVGVEGTFTDNFTVTDHLGEYVAQTQVDTYLVNVYPPSPYWNPCVEDVPITFNGQAQFDTINFGVGVDIVCPWLDVNIAGPCWVRRDQQIAFTYQVCNNGTALADSMVVNFELPANLNNIDISIPYIQNGSIYSIWVDSLPFGQCFDFRVTGIVDTTTPLGSILCATADVRPNDICLAGYNGYVPTEFDYCTEVVGSYDPNAKSTNPRGYGPDRLVEKNTRMNYNIQFQNTGNDTAFRVIIIDTLPPELDITTIKPGASSHPYTFSVSGDSLHIVRFTFDPIILPDSNVNEPASNGYVGFSIEQVLDLPDGTIIANDAAIYFDFNAPVITDPWTNKIGRPDSTVSVANSVISDHQISLYPNPGEGQVIITESIDNAEIERVEVFGVDGRLQHIKADNFVRLSSGIQLDLSQLPLGMKFIRITIGQRVLTEKYLLVD